MIGHAEVLVVIVVNIVSGSRAPKPAPSVKWSVSQVKLQMNPREHANHKGQLDCAGTGRQRGSTANSSIAARTNHGSKALLLSYLPSANRNLVLRQCDESGYT